MSHRSDVLEFLRQAPTVFFCAGCVALEIKASLEEARTMITELEQDRLIDRCPGACWRCGRLVEVTRIAKAT